MFRLAATIFDRVRPRHALSVAVYDQAGKQAGFFCDSAECPLLPVAIQLLLDELPDLSIDDRFVLARIDVP
jgi:hypothetical protein